MGWFFYRFWLKLLKNRLLEYFLPENSKKRAKIQKNLRKIQKSWEKFKKTKENSKNSDKNSNFTIFSQQLTKPETPIR